MGCVDLPAAEGAFTRFPWDPRRCWFRGNIWSLARSEQHCKGNRVRPESGGFRGREGLYVGHAVLRLGWGRVSGEFEDVRGGVSGGSGEMLEAMIGEAPDAESVRSSVISGGDDLWRSRGGAELGEVDGEASAGERGL